MGSIVIYQIAVNDSLTVGIVKNRLSEYLSGVQRRCCSQRNFHGIKVLNDGTVFADVVILVTVEHLGFAHFLIQNISTVCFVNHNQIVVCNGGHGISLGIEDTLNKTLDRCDMYFCFSVYFLFIQALDVIDGIQGHQFFVFYVLEYIFGLLTKSSTVNQDQDSLESVALNKAIDHAKDGTSLSGAGSHGQQNSLFAIDDSLFCRLNSIDLILTQIQSIRVTEQIERCILECGICGSNILFELFHQALRTDPALQGFGCIGSAA